MSTLADYLSFAQAHPELFVNPPQGDITILLNEDEIYEAEKQEAQRLEAQGMPAEWAQVGIAYRDQYVLLLRDAVRFADGSLGTVVRSVDENEHAPGIDSNLFTDYPVYDKCYFISACPKTAYGASKSAGNLGNNQNKRSTRSHWNTWDSRVFWDDWNHYASSNPI